MIFSVVFVLGLLALITAVYGATKGPSVLWIAIVLVAIAVMLMAGAKLV